MSDPVRDELESAIGEYWCIAYQEGKEGRDHDTADGAAADCLHRIGALIDALATPVGRVPDITRFADMIAEECAKVCEQVADDNEGQDSYHAYGCFDSAAAIRTMFKE